MKKLLFLSIAALFSLVSANVFGQSTGNAPAPGATHNYHITDNGNTMLWTVTKGNLTTDAGAEAAIANAGAAATDITWNVTNAEVGTWYYVHILETNTTTNCSNEKVLPVQITASPFYLTLAANGPSQCYDGAVSVSIDSSDPSLVKYDHGTATVKFTVTPSGYSSSYDGYSFDLGIAYGGYTGLTETVAASVSSGTATISGTKVSVSENVPVTLTYSITNNTKFTNSTDATGSAADFTATVSISGGKTQNGVSDNGNTAHNDATNVARPHTSGIQFN